MATRKIHVIECKPVHSGTGQKGEWTLYEVTATNLDGSPIDLKLKTFAKLSGEVEVEVEKQEHEKYGTSYMLKPAGGSQSPGARLGPKVDELRDRVERLEEQVKYLLSEVEGLRTVAHNAGREPQPAAQRPSGGASFGDDDDIPFAPSVL